MTDEDTYETEEEGQDIQSQIQIAELDLTIIYWCLPNNCNSRSSAELIRKAVKDHYNMSAMYEVLKVKIEDNSEENSTIPTISNEINTIPSVPSLTSTKETSTTTTSSTKTTTATTITTITSTITTTKQPNNTATSLHISVIITIFNAVLFFLN